MKYLICFFISEETVKVHIRNITFKKLRVRSRLEASLICYAFQDNFFYNCINDKS
ncbi:LuxR C-terminal-related transcriptional regulator [Providencia hangzhouensis]